MRRVSPFFDYAILVLIAVTAGFLRRIERFDLLLGGVAASAAYCLIALGTLSQWSLWLPGILPLGAIWVSILLALLFPRENEAAVSIPPPIA